LIDVTCAQQGRGEITEDHDATVRQVVPEAVGSPGGHECWLRFASCRWGF